MKKITSALALTAGLLLARGALAMDYVEFARSTLLPCVHSTVNVDKAKAEYAKEPVTEGEMTTARVKVFYKGWIRSNSMLFEIKNRHAGSINQIRAEVLEDSSPVHSPDCKYLEGWQDL